MAATPPTVGGLAANTVFIPIPTPTSTSGTAAAAAAVIVPVVANCRHHSQNNNNRRNNNSNNNNNNITNNREDAKAPTPMTDGETAIMIETAMETPCPSTAGSALLLDPAAASAASLLYD